MKLRTLMMVLLLTACGGRPQVNSSQHELDQRHCTANGDCASGLCQNGRCG
jgi:hypothetical protein